MSPDPVSGPRSRVNVHAKTLDTQVKVYVFINVVIMNT